MLNMNWKLEQREKEGNIIKVGIVGAGQMGPEWLLRWFS
jgi:predicted homoserine dehydrogenase-like protein